MELTIHFKLSVANILKGICQWEIDIENKRMSLAENPNFNIFLCFQLLDRSQSDSQISVDEIKTFLSLNQFSATQRECDYIMQLNSTDGKMTIDSLIDTLLPKTNNRLKMLSLERAQ